MLVQSLIMDIVAVLVIVLCVAYYSKKGFVAGVINFIGTLAALVAGWLAAKYLSPIIFNSFFRPGLEDSIATTITQNGVQDMGGLLQQVLSALPDELVNSIVAAMDPSLDFTAGDIARQVVDQVVAPLVIPFISVIVFFVVFALVRVLFVVIRVLLSSIARMPLISTANSALGAAVGVLIAALYIYLGLCVVWGYDYLSPAQRLGETYFSRSIVFSLLEPLNFFANI